MSSVVPAVRARVVRRTGVLAALALALAVLGASPAAAHNALQLVDWLRAAT